MVAFHWNEMLYFSNGKTQSIGMSCPISLPKATRLYFAQSPTPHFSDLVWMFCWQLLLLCRRRQSGQILCQLSLQSSSFTLRSVSSYIRYILEKRSFPEKFGNSQFLPVLTRFVAGILWWWKKEHQVWLKKIFLQWKVFLGSTDLWSLSLWFMRT